MLFTTIVAAFFLNRTTSSPVADELVVRAGLTDPRPLSELDRRALGLNEPGRTVVSAQWGAFGDVWATIDSLERHDCLLIFASLRRYYAATSRQETADAPSPADPTLPFVQTFREACLSMVPDVAFLDARTHYGDEQWRNKEGNREWVLAHYGMVLQSDANALADERFNLLYLSEPLSRLWDSTPVRDDRDMVEVPSGLLVYARSGPNRMA